ncbi:hypothetical protein FJQ98_18135 [Lysinibacillus agricola]|uniref:Stage III sporulation protein AD n=1 Tax=Lysinibacillus agricola TaxID=2590012 RepID=A0ABX7AMU9_9BACI|nr:MULTISPECIES: hypothetical protein [Lysinibacillus]KOS60094.1 hypothetical protein AN161_25185 [Lysinibacillus sp. FJAT-14222]QQP11140.1 hypothetical protein FJQ98_18135 [Lysinibacillus agricola]
MEIVIIAVIMLLLLLLIKEVIQPLHALISVMFSFLLFGMLFSTLLLPFIKQLLETLAFLPYAKAIVVSASLFYIGQWMSMLLVEQNYKVLGNIVYDGVKIVILLYWFKEFLAVLQEVSAILQRLN